jgi:CubicO group peptidase (beta-lactamase class C family)
VALAAIITRVTGRPWTEHIDERVFTPAGLTATVPTNVTPRPPRLAIGHWGEDNSRKAADWPALRASGAFVSNVLELAKWDAMLYTDRVLTESEQREMWTPVRLNDGRTAPYGLGWHVHEERRGQRRLWHGGGLPGFVSQFARFVDQRLTVVVLTNGEDVDLPSIVSGVAALYQRTPVPAGAGTR